MPELPEVETIRLGLQKYIIGHTIEKIEVRYPKIFTGDVKKVRGTKVQSVRRRGKGLIIDLNNDYSIAAHVKMTGQFIYKKVSKEKKVSHVSNGDNEKITRNFHPKLSLVGELPNMYTHVIFHLDQNATLFYNDVRKFGWLRIIETNNVLDLPFFQGLGPEPFVDLTEALFVKILKKAKLPIKQLLMDQRRIAGVGNIYANDALWKAMIDPRRSAASLTKQESKRLYTAVLFVLTEGLKYKGASETNFFHVDGSKGDYQNHFLVYGKTGKPCKRCGELIERIVMGGRGTFVCKSCQC